MQQDKTSQMASKPVSVTPKTLQTTQRVELTFIFCSSCLHEWHEPQSNKQHVFLQCNKCMTKIWFRNATHIIQSSFWTQACDWQVVAMAAVWQLSSKRLAVVLLQLLAQLSERWKELSKHTHCLCFHITRVIN